MVEGGIGRFGWKAQTSTLREFSADALLNELGITTPDFPDEVGPGGGPVTCDAISDPEDDGSGIEELAVFMQLLAPLQPGRAPGIGRGRGLFRKIGCTGCHVMMLRTGENDSRALHRQRVRLFSDLLLHDMGPELADGIEQGEAKASEFRTAPLWGAGRRGPYLHDGRAVTLEQAVLAHGGEAQTVRARFQALTAEDRAAVLAFLANL